MPGILSLIAVINIASTLAKDLSFNGSLEV